MTGQDFWHWFQELPQNWFHLKFTRVLRSYASVETPHLERGLWQISLEKPVATLGCVLLSLSYMSLPLLMSALKSTLEVKKMKLQLRFTLTCSEILSCGLSPESLIHPGRSLWKEPLRMLQAVAQGCVPQCHWQSSLVTCLRIFQSICWDSLVCCVAQMLSSAFLVCYFWLSALLFSSQRPTWCLMRTTRNKDKNSLWHFSYPLSGSDGSTTAIHKNITI